MGKGIPAALVGTAVKTQFMRFAIPYQHVKIWDKQGYWHEDQPTPTEILYHVQEEISKSSSVLNFLSLYFMHAFKGKNGFLIISIAGQQNRSISAKKS